LIHDLEEDVNVTSKQNLRINVLAAAVLSLSAGASAYAAGLPAKEPVRQPAAAQASSSSTAPAPLRPRIVRPS